MQININENNNYKTILRKILLYIDIIKIYYCIHYKAYNEMVSFSEQHKLAISRYYF